jgi:hypothetical protein
MGGFGVCQVGQYPGADGRISVSAKARPRTAMLAGTALDSRVTQMPELVEIVSGICAGTVAFLDDGAQFAGDHEQARHGEPVPGQGAVSVAQGTLELAPARGDNAGVTRVSALRKGDSSIPVEPVPIRMTSAA